MHSALLQLFEQCRHVQSSRPLDATCSTQQGRQTAATMPAVAAIVLLFLWILLLDKRDRSVTTCNVYERAEHRGRFRVVCARAISRAGPRVTRLAVCCVCVRCTRSVVEVLTQLNQVQRPRSHHRPSSLQLLGIASKSAANKPLHHASTAGSSAAAAKSRSPTRRLHSAAGSTTGSTTGCRV